MEVKDVIFEDFINYKKISMFIIFPNCSFKCNREYGGEICQNSSIAKQPNINVSLVNICAKYKRNRLSQAVVCGGLEPFDSEKDLFDFIKKFREFSDDDIVIYTGYTEKELKNQIEKLKKYKNIIIKFGRYIPNQKKHYDALLGVYLASPNQYAKRIS